MHNLKLNIKCNHIFFFTFKCHRCHHILDLINVKGSAVELLDAMLEETSSQTHFVAQVRKIFNIKLKGGHWLRTMANTIPLQKREK